MPLSSAQHSLTQFPLVVKNTGKAFAHLGQDFAYKPAMVQTDAMILSTFGLVTARVMIAFGSAAKEIDPDQKALRWREAIRTAIREYGGWIASYLVLKGVRNLTEKATSTLTGLKKVAQQPIGFRKLGRDLRAQFKALATGKPLPTPVASSLQALEATAPIAFSNHSILKSGFEKLSKNFLFRGLNPDQGLRIVHQALPITVGSLAALGLSGFALEWFTLRHADNVAKVVADWTHKHRTYKQDKAMHAMQKSAAQNGLPLQTRMTSAPDIQTNQAVTPVLLSPQSPLWFNPVDTLKPYAAGTFAAAPGSGVSSLPNGVPNRVNPFAWTQQ